MSNGSGVGQVVNVFAFYYDDPSSNPAKAYSFSLKTVVEMIENKLKVAGIGPFWLVKVKAKSSLLLILHLSTID